MRQVGDESVRSGSTFALSFPSPGQRSHVTRAFVSRRRGGHVKLPTDQYCHVFSGDNDAADEMAKQGAFGTILCRDIACDAGLHASAVSTGEHQLCCCICCCFLTFNAASHVNGSNHSVIKARNRKRTERWLRRVSSRGSHIRRENSEATRGTTRVILPLTIANFVLSFHRNRSHVT